MPGWGTEWGRRCPKLWENHVFLQQVDLDLCFDGEASLLSRNTPFPGVVGKQGCDAHPRPLHGWSCVAGPCPESVLSSSTLPGWWRVGRMLRQDRCLLQTWTPSGSDGWRPRRRGNRCNVSPAFEGTAAPRTHPRPITASRPPAQWTGCWS